jgi:hypothetical protein
MQAGWSRNCVQTLGKGAKTTARERYWKGRKNARKFESQEMRFAIKFESERGEEMPTYNYRYNYPYNWCSYRL